MVISTDLLDLVSEHVQMKKASATEYHGPCVFCNNGTDRFIVWPEQNRYLCRKCEQKGDTYQFCKDHLQMDHNDILTALGRGAERKNSVQLTTFEKWERRQRAKRPNSKIGSSDQNALDMLPKMQSELVASAKNWGRWYLNGRGISTETAKKHGIGFQVPGQHSPFPNTPHGRIVAPHHSPDGTVINLYSRVIETKQNRADKKQRHRHLPGEKGVFNAPALSQPVVFVCEGVFDALSLLEAGYPAVAIYGLDMNKMDWIKAPTTPIAKGPAHQDVILCLDNDEAGREKAKSWAGMLITLGKSVHILPLSEGSDVNTEWRKGKLNVMGHMDQGMHLWMLAHHQGVIWEGRQKYREIYEALGTPEYWELAKGYVRA